MWCNPPYYLLPLNNTPTVSHVLYHNQNAVIFTLYIHPVSTIQTIRSLEEPILRPYFCQKASNLQLLTNLLTLIVLLWNLLVKADYLHIVLVRIRSYISRNKVWIMEVSFLFYGWFTLFSFFCVFWMDMYTPREIVENYLLFLSF